MALEDSSSVMQAYVEKAMVDLPSLPTTIVQVVQAMESETVTTRQIEDLIGTDPAVVTKLLKVVNSAYFGMPRQIGSISQAIAILGMHQVRNLVLSIGVLNALSGDSTRTEIMQRRFWERSFGAAACAQLLAQHKKLHPKEQEALFVAGLLHDIGILFMLTQFTAPYLEVLEHSFKNDEPLIDVERRLMKTDHASLGGMLAEIWNFPEGLEELIRCHEEPGNPDEMPAVACIHAAGRIACSLMGGDFTGCPQQMAPEVADWLDMSDDQLDELKEQVRAQVGEAAEFLGLLV
ncbi:MAG: HDOD domain-containing protein [Armatimonadetes bacterium]|nr:HDOD domain-containing protein [Armatimonadota bacterium]